MLPFAHAQNIYTKNDKVIGKTYVKAITQSKSVMES